jgi:hypothetical protein
MSFDPDNVVVRISDTLTQIKPSDLDRAEPCPPGFDPAQRQNVRRGYFCSDHPDMPTFRFTREDARAFVLYLRSIQTP